MTSIVSGSRSLPGSRRWHRTERPAGTALWPLACVRRAALRALAIAVFLLSAERAAAQPRLPHVEARGSGPTDVVLISCHGCDWRSWEPFMQRNQSRYRMLAVTLPGMGGGSLADALAAASPERRPPSDTPIIDVAARAVAGLLRERTSGGAVVIGHSLGAVVALRVATEYPELVGRIILVDWGAVHPGNATLGRAERLQRARSRAAAVGAMSDSTFHAELRDAVRAQIGAPLRVPVYVDMMDALDRHASARYSSDIQAVDLRPALRQLAAPVLGLFAGSATDDGGAREREVAAVTAGIPILRLRWFPGAGHWIHEERPTDFDDAVAEFIANRPSAAARNR